MDRVGEIERLVEPPLAGLGYRLVQVQFVSGRTPTLQVMVERGDGSSMTVDDCAEISRSLSAVLDVEDPIGGSYTLEVSSPGIDRPLVRKADFARFAGFEARLETRRLIDGQRRFKGRLTGVEGEEVMMDCDGGEARIPFGDILRGKLSLTDELIAATINNEDR